MELHSSNNIISNFGKCMIQLDENNLPLTDEGLQPSGFDLEVSPSSMFVESVNLVVELNP